MWWAGYPIPQRCARDLLAEAARGWEEWVRVFREELGAGGAEELDDSDAIWEALDASETARPRRKLLTQMRKRVGRASFPTLFRIILEVGSGSFTGYRPAPKADPRDDERLLVSAAIGFPPGRKTGRTLLDDPRIARDTEAFLKGVSRVLMSAHPRADLEAMTDAELLAARDELRAFEPLIPVLPELGEEALGNQGRSLRALADTLMAMGPIDQAMALLFWHELRLQGLGPKMDAYVRLAVLAPVWLPMVRGAQMRDDPSVPADSTAADDGGGASTAADAASTASTANNRVNPADTAEEESRRVRRVRRRVRRTNPPTPSQNS
jgi:hypothetical protein